VAIVGFIERILEHPGVYTTWQAPFVSQKFAPVERRLKEVQVRRVLDVGCGPGTNARHFTGADYVGLDINEDYLRIARSKYRGRFIQADLQTSDLTAFGSFDVILINSFLHHLPDHAVTRILAQLEPLLEADGRIHVLELVLPERRSLARLMARLDRGKYARSATAWTTLFATHFDATLIEPYHFAGGLWSMLYFQGRAKSCVSQ
jgi:SAM-dependent methyltransferase